MAWEEMIVVEVPGVAEEDLGGLDTSGFVQWANIDGAEAWIQRAVDVTRPEVEYALDRQPFAKQLAGVKDALTAISNVYRDANIRWQYDPPAWELWQELQGPYTPMDEVGCTFILGPSTIAGGTQAIFERLKQMWTETKGSYPTYEDWDVTDPNYAAWQAWRTDPAIAAASEQGRPVPPGPPEPRKVQVPKGMTIIVPAFLNYSSQPVLIDTSNPAAGLTPAGKFDGLYTGASCPRPPPGVQMGTPEGGTSLVPGTATPGTVVTDPNMVNTGGVNLGGTVTAANRFRQLGAYVPGDTYHEERSDTSVFDWNCFRFDDSPQTVQILGTGPRLGLRIQQPLRWSMPVLRAWADMLAKRGARRIIMDTRIRSILRNLERAKEAGIANDAIGTQVFDTIKSIEASKHVSAKDLATVNAATTAICAVATTANPLAGAGCALVGAAVNGLAQLIPLAAGCDFDQWHQPIPSGIQPRLFLRDPEQWTADDHRRYDVPEPPPMEATTPRIYRPAGFEGDLSPVRIALRALTPPPPPDVPKRTDETPVYTRTNPGGTQFSPPASKPSAPAASGGLAQVAVPAAALAFAWWLLS